MALIIGFYEENEHYTFGIKKKTTGHYQILISTF